MKGRRPHLRALADRLGILLEFKDANGRRRVTSQRTAEALVSALGYGGSTESAAKQSLEQLNASLREAKRFPKVKTQSCYGVHRVLKKQRGYGLWVNLYSLRGESPSGIGTLGDLKALIRPAALLGASFIGINPLHALSNRPGQISPYSPTSRLFRNFIYLDIEAISEFKASAIRRSPAVKRALGRIAKLDVLDNIQYAAVAKLKMDILRQLHQHFVAKHGIHDSQRGRDYQSYLKRQGAALIDFATFTALADRFTAANRPVDFHKWPREYCDPHSPVVERFRNECHTEVDLHCYIQFEFDRQLQQVARVAAKQGMKLGLYQDLALASDGGGSDVWANRGLFVENVSIGAPPDALAKDGQNWTFPPINPFRLQETRYEYWVNVLRATLAHSGMIRIDHIMGLFRQYWIPKGFDPNEGAYIRFPANELLGILARESRRHKVIVVGEDLGTVPPEVPRELKRRGILSTKVLYFEKDSRGSFRSPKSYSRNALVMATTHDLPTLPAYLWGHDIVLRDSIGLIRSMVQLRRQELARGVEIRALAKALGDLMFQLARELPQPKWSHWAWERSTVHLVSSLVRCIYWALASAPSPLLAVMLDDLAGEITPVNIPGTNFRRYPNWTRRMKRSIKLLLEDFGISSPLVEIGCFRRNPVLYSRMMSSAR